MKWTKAILTFITTLLIPAVLLNLYLGHSTTPFFELLKFQIGAMIYFAVPLIATVLIFASELERAKKVKWMWVTLSIYLVLLIVLAFILKISFEGGFILGETAGWIMLGLMIIGGAYIVWMAIATALLSYLLRFEEQKQMRVIIIAFVILFILDLLQLFGLLRPGLME